MGTHLDASSSVQAILDLFGPTNLLTILDQSTLHGYKVRAPALALLLGADVIAVPALARKARPVHQVDASDPPLLIIHGDQEDIGTGGIGMQRHDTQGNDPVFHNFYGNLWFEGDLNGHAS